MSNHPDFHSNSEALAESIDSMFLHLSCIADQQKFEQTSTTLQGLYLKKAPLKYKPVL